MPTKERWATKKAGMTPALLLRVSCLRRVPGQSELHPGREGHSRRLLLLGLLGFLRLFRLLRFLSHSILSGFNGLKRDTRHARRRASLAKTSRLIPADSLAAASSCHVRVMALSTDVMHFDALSFKNDRPRTPRASIHAAKTGVRRAFAVARCAPWRGRRTAKMWRICASARCRRGRSSSIPNHNSQSMEELRVR
jgi:hypothetical protein